MQPNPTVTLIDELMKVLTKHREAVIDTPAPPPQVDPFVTAGVDPVYLLPSPLPVQKKAETPGFLSCFGIGCTANPPTNQKIPDFDAEMLKAWKGGEAGEIPTQSEQSAITHFILSKIKF